MLSLNHKIINSIKMEFRRRYSLIEKWNIIRYADMNPQLNRRAVAQHFGIPLNSVNT